MSVSGVRALDGVLLRMGCGEIVGHGGSSKSPVTILAGADQPDPAADTSGQASGVLGA